MKLHFLGTGAAEGVPAVFCKCPTCEEIRRRGKKEFHSRSQLLIDENVCVDFPPDAYAHSLRFGVDLTAIEHLLVTHSHMDHFYAHDFVLRGYKYTRTPLKALHIYGNEEVKKVYEECTRRELRDDVAQTIFVHTIQPFEPFFFDGYKATALLAQHSVKETAYVYLIEKGNILYLHLTDTGRLPLPTLEWLQAYCQKENKCVNAVTFDCTFLFSTGGEVSRHMGLEDNRIMQEELHKRNITNEHSRYVITHYSHNNAPLSETLSRAQTQYGYLSAYDGMTLEI